MSDIIGGEFAIDPNLINSENCFKPNQNEYLYASGRGALYHILLNIRKNYPGVKTILLPRYLCSSITEAVDESGLNYLFYGITEILLPDISKLLELSNSSTCILLINYFGLLDIEPVITKIKDELHDQLVILDNVQAFFEMRKKTEADYSFTSMRKWFSVPDGAMVITRENGMTEPNEANTFSQWKFAAGLLKKYRGFQEIEDSAYLELFTRGEELIRGGYNYVCSTISLAIINQVCFSGIVSRRRENALFLYDNLNGINNSLPIINDVQVYKEMVPMFFPVRTKNRDALRKKFIDNKIFCPIHWPSALPCDVTRQESNYSMELSLVIDQRYSIKDMERLLDIINDAKPVN